MSVKNEINRIKKSIVNSYSSCESKHAVLPSIQNVENLPATIDSISGEGPPIEFEEIELLEELRTLYGNYFIDTSGNIFYSIRAEDPTQESTLYIYTSVTKSWIKYSISNDILRFYEVQNGVYLNDIDHLYFYNYTTGIKTVVLTVFSQYNLIIPTSNGDLYFITPFKIYLHNSTTEAFEDFYTPAEGIELHSGTVYNHIDYILLILGPSPNIILNIHKINKTYTDNEILNTPRYCEQIECIPRGNNLFIITTNDTFDFHDLHYYSPAHGVINLCNLRTEIEYKITLPDSSLVFSIMTPGGQDRQLLIVDKDVNKYIPEFSTTVPINSILYTKDKLIISHDNINVGIYNLITREYSMIGSGPIKYGSQVFSTGDAILVGNNKSLLYKYNSDTITPLDDIGMSNKFIEADTHIFAGYNSDYVDTYVIKKSNYSITTLPNTLGALPIGKNKEGKYILVQYNGLVGNELNTDIKADYGRVCTYDISNNVLILYSLNRGYSQKYGKYLIPLQSSSKVLDLETLEQTKLSGGLLIEGKGLIVNSNSITRISDGTVTIIPGEAYSLDKVNDDFYMVKLGGFNNTLINQVYKIKGK